MANDPNSNAPRNRKEKGGKERAKDAIEFSDTLDANSGDQKIRNEMKDALQKLYNDTEALPNSSSYRALLPEKGNIKQINEASMEDIKKWSKTIKQRRAEYEQQVKKIAPAATPDKPAAPAPAAPAQAPAPPTASAQPVTPTATPEQVTGLKDAIKADSPVNKLMAPPSFPTASAPQAAQPFEPTAPQVGPTAAQAPAAPPQIAPAPPNPRVTTTPPAGAATIPSFKAQLDAKLAAMNNPAPAASTFKQLQPQDEVAAMEEQMIGGGYQIPKGGLKKDSAGYHVIDEKGRKLMVAPTAAMRFNVQERLNGMGRLSKELKPGQTMSDMGSAYMGRAPQPVANTTVRDAQARLNQMHLADQQAVMKAYPLIGNKGGAMNKLFTDAYHAAPKGTDMMKLAKQASDAYNAMPQEQLGQPAQAGPPAAGLPTRDAIAAQSPIEQMMKPPTSTMMKAAYANRPPPPQPLGSAETGQVSAYTMNGKTPAPVSKMEDGIPSANLQQGTMGMKTPETRSVTPFRGIEETGVVGNYPLETVRFGAPRPIIAPSTEGGGRELNDFYSQPQDYNGVVMQTTDQQELPKAQSADPNFIAKEILGKPVDDPFAGMTGPQIQADKDKLAGEQQAAKAASYRADFAKKEEEDLKAKARTYNPNPSPWRPAY